MDDERRAAVELKLMSDQLGDPAARMQARQRLLARLHAFVDAHHDGLHFSHMWQLKFGPPTSHQQENGLETMRFSSLGVCLGDAPKEAMFRAPPAASYTVEGYVQRQLRDEAAQFLNSNPVVGGALEVGSDAVTFFARARAVLTALRGKNKKMGLAMEAALEQATKANEDAQARSELRKTFFVMGFGDYVAPILKRKGSISDVEHNKLFDDDWQPTAERLAVESLIHDVGRLQELAHAAKALAHAIVAIESAEIECLVRFAAWWVEHRSWC